MRTKLYFLLTSFLPPLWRARLDNSIACSLWRKGQLAKARVFIKPEDAKEWVEWLKEHRSNPVYWRLASFMLMTGTRVSEACGLKWDAVDLDQSLIRIIRRVSWDRRTTIPTLEDVTKTNSSISEKPA